MIEFHEHAAIFPMIDDLALLVIDIKNNGLRIPIVLYEGKILDGRNRYLACQQANVEPRFVTYSDDDPIQFVVSLNCHRRHMTPSQLGVAALRIEACEAVEAKKRQATSTGGANPQLKAIVPEADKCESETIKTAPQARDTAAKMVGASPRYVQDAKLIAKERPELLAQIESGKKTIPEAKREIVRAKKVEVIADISKASRPLDSGLGAFPLIYCDPPWRYDYVETENRAIEQHYPTMNLEEIRALPVAAVTTKDCIIFMWATSPKLDEALSVMRAWGFTYRTCAVWDKEKIGMGYYFRQQHELLLIGVKGNIPVPEPANRPSSVIREARGKHSAKPLIIYDIIEAMYPELPKLELFARVSREGWASWGNQANA